MGNSIRKRYNGLKRTLIEANREGKAVIAFFHHGILEHYTGNATFSRIFDRKFSSDSKIFCFYNVRMVFTGHFHANDISMQEFNGKVLYDIETGSLVSAPSPIAL